MGTMKQRVWRVLELTIPALLLLLGMFLLVSLAGCNTIEGIQRDITGAVDGITRNYQENQR